MESGPYFLPCYYLVFIPSTCCFPATLAIFLVLLKYWAPFLSQNFCDLCSIYLNYSSLRYLHNWLLIIQILAQKLPPGAVFLNLYFSTIDILGWYFLWETIPLGNFLWLLLCRSCISFIKYISVCIIVFILSSVELVPFEVNLKHNYFKYFLFNMNLS